MLLFWTPAQMSLFRQLDSAALTITAVFIRCISQYSDRIGEYINLIREISLLNRIFPHISRASGRHHTLKTWNPPSLVNEFLRNSLLIGLLYNFS